MYAEIAWVLVSLRTQVQPQVIVATPQIGSVATPFPLDFLSKNL